MAVAEPGPLAWGQITDVPGILVGQAQRLGDGWRTGVTVVLPPPGSTAAVDVRGGGPGTRETDALDPTTLVQGADAFVLAGGSAYGLAAADGVMRWCEQNGRGFAVGPPNDPTSLIVPIVPSAVIFDLGRGGNPGLRPDAELGFEAAAAAASGAVGVGSVGAGTGALTDRMCRPGGVGTACISVPGTDLLVGALVVVNALGSPFDPVTGALLSWAFVPPELPRPALTAPPLPVDDSSSQAPSAMPVPGANTTIGVVATNARLTPARLKRMTMGAHDGLARSLRPVHTLLDGDTLFGVATGGLPDDLDPAQTMALDAAAADAVMLAVTSAVLANEWAGMRE